jgi:alpha-1,3-rhamnosyl/mannosyltransferase
VRIGIGALVGVLGGPATYARELVAALARAGGHDYVVFTDRPDGFADLGVATVHVPLPTAAHQVTWDHWRLPALLARHRIDLYHGTKNVLPWRLPVRAAVVTVHDLAVYACPDTFSRGQRWHFQLAVPPSLRRAARVLADSEHARRDIVARFGLAPEGVTAVPLGVAPRFLAVTAGEAEALRSRLGLGERLVVCVGTVQPRKHVERVIEAYERAGGVRTGWELVIAGRLRPGYRPSWIDALPAGVRWLGPLSDADLPALNAAAAIAVNASDYEGFGLSVCEAMAAGCAVIAVGQTSVPEVVGDAARLVPRSDATLLAGELTRLLGDAEERRALSARARARAAGFTWDETARRTRAVYEEVLV